MKQTQPRVTLNLEIKNQNSKDMTTDNCPLSGFNPKGAASFLFEKRTPLTDYVIYRGWYKYIPHHAS